MSGMRSKEDEAFVDALVDHPILTPSQINRLHATYTAGRDTPEGLRARNEIVRCFGKLVVSISNRYPLAHVDEQTRIQEGMLGLIRAVELFDPSKGFALSTFASPHIRARIGRSVMTQNDNYIIHNPVHRQELRLKVARTRRELSASLGRDAEIDEVAEVLDMSVRDVEAALNNEVRANSLDATLGLDEGLEFTLHDVVESQDPSAQETMFADESDRRVNAAIDKLGSRKAEIIRLVHGIGGEREHSYSEVAEMFGLTRARIGQLVEDAEAELARAYLDWTG